MGSATHGTLIKSCRYLLVNQHEVCCLTKRVAAMSQDGRWAAEFVRCRGTRHGIPKQTHSVPEISKKRSPALTSNVSHLATSHLTSYEVFNAVFKTNLINKFPECVNWIKVVHDTVPLRVLVNTAMCLWVPYNARNFFAS